MDAYSDYNLRTANARLDTMRREAAERAMSRAARPARTSWWQRARGRLPELVGEPVGSPLRPEAFERI